MTEGKQQAFSNKFLEGLTPKKYPYRVYERGISSGFGVQIAAGGKKSFVYLYRAPDNNKQRVMTLGEYPRLSLLDARQEWIHWRNVREQGLDPQDVRRADEAAARSASPMPVEVQPEWGSLRDLLENYVANLKAENKRSWVNVGRMFEANVYPVLKGSCKAMDIKPEHIKTILFPVYERGRLIMANRLRSCLSAAFTFGIYWDNDVRHFNDSLQFGLTSNPVSVVPKPTKKESLRDRALTPDEIERLWSGMASSGVNVRVCNALRLMLALGGQRVEEVLRLHTNSIDWEKRLIELPNTKKGNTHVIPFGEVAAGVLRQCAIHTDDNGALFAKAKGAIGDTLGSGYISEGVRKLCEVLKLDAFQPKDIRRTVKTQMGYAGISKENRDLFQNHSRGDVSSVHYDRYNYLREKRAVMDVWDKYLAGIVS